jgi:hypothetical protein
LAKGDVFPARRTEQPGIMPGSRVSRFAPWDDGNQYVPYFYNPSLDAAGQRMIFTGNRAGGEQVYLLDLERDDVTQLTQATGSGQNWSPYIRENVRGIRPQFIAWAQPEYDNVVYFDGNTLCLVNATTLTGERLHDLPDDVVPSVLHCSPAGWVAWGYLPRTMQETMRQGASVFELDEELRTGCGFNVYDLTTRQLVLDVPVPFWPNHVSASPDHKHVLCCHEGLWELQRMYLYDVESGNLQPLRPQDDGVKIGHEFWIDAQTVGYHGSDDAAGFFGTIDVETGERTERPSPIDETHFYGHYHLSPDQQFIVTDGEVTADKLSISPLTTGQLSFTPVCTHNWAREQDQRFHPHPNWHQGGRLISFTGCETTATGETHSRVCLLELPQE